MRQSELFISPQAGFLWWHTYRCKDTPWETVAMSIWTEITLHQHEGNRQARKVKTSESRLPAQNLSHRLKLDRHAEERDKHKGGHQADPQHEGWAVPKAVD